MFNNKHFFNFILNTPYTPNLANSLLPLAVGFVASFLHIEIAGFFILVSMFLMAISAYQWVNDLDIEGTYIGVYAKKTLALLGVGFLLFIGSESFIFGTFYSSFIHFVTNTNIYMDRRYKEPVPLLDYHAYVVIDLALGKGFPAEEVIPDVFAWMFLTFWNSPLTGSTAVLVFSSITVMYMFKELKYKQLNDALYMYMFFTLFLGLFFIDLQYKEYVHFRMRINDGSFASSFYTLTGFHGLHVIIGVILLCIQFERFNTTLLSGVGIHTAELYWHFVDIIWIILVITVYFAYIRFSR